MVRKTGFDPVASCSPSTRSAWLSYVLFEMMKEAGVTPTTPIPYNPICGGSFA